MTRMGLCRLLCSRRLVHWRTRLRLHRVRLHLRVNTSHRTHRSHRHLHRHLHLWVLHPRLPHGRLYRRLHRLRHVPHAVSARVRRRLGVVPTLPRGQRAHQRGAHTSHLRCLRCLCCLCCLQGLLPILFCSSHPSKNRTFFVHLAVLGRRGELQVRQHHPARVQAVLRQFRVVETPRERHPVIDAVVLEALHVRTRRDSHALLQRGLEQATQEPIVGSLVEPQVPAIPHVLLELHGQSGAQLVQRGLIVTRSQHRLHPSCTA